MPQILIRGCSNELVSRVRVYARARGLHVPDAGKELLEAGLTLTENRVKGAMAVNADKTPEERSEAARKAVKARWKNR